MVLVEGKPKNQEPDLDKIGLYVKDPLESNDKLLIKRRK